jgi:hypothetical protein
MVMVFCVVNDHVNNFDPAMKGTTGTNKEVVTVEYLQDVGFELFE